jgi:hypothetical protein
MNDTKLKEITFGDPLDHPFLVLETIEFDISQE